MSPGVRRLSAAGRHLVAGEPERALRGVEDPAFSESLTAEAIRLVASGLIAEDAGRDAEARRCFDDALALGVPLAPLLRTCGRYYKRVGAYERAHHCYALLEGIRPGAIREFTKELPRAELARHAPWLIPAMVSGPKPRLYALQPVKAALAAELGPDGAAAAYAQLAGVRLGRSRRMPLFGLQEYARARGLAYEEIAPSRDVKLPTPPRFGAPSRGHATMRTRTFFFCQLEDAVVSSRSNVTVVRNRALLDVQAEEWDLYPLDLDVDPIVVAPSVDEATIVIGRGALGEPSLPEAFSLVGIHSYNFGHWLIEFLPRVWACMDRPGFDSVPIVVDEQMHPQLRPALEFFVGPEHPIRVLRPGEAIRVRTLWTCSMPAYFPPGPRPGESESDEPMTIDDEVFAGLVERVRPTLEQLDRPDGPKRIYLTRSDTGHRRLVNRPEVEEFFRADGFEVFDPGQLPFVEQLRRVRGADVIAGPDGSAMWLAFLARPGARVAYLNNPYLEEHWWIAANHEALGHRLRILTGEVVNETANYRKFSDYRIDVSQLRPFVDDLLR